MSFLLIDDVKTDFPLWDKFCLDDHQIPQESILQREMDLADDKLQQYIAIADGTTLPDWLKLHLFNIVRKFCFDLRHGDTEFMNKPTIVKEYEQTIEALKMLLTQNNGVPIDLTLLLNRIAASGSNNKISITTKKRMFGPGGGFTEYEQDEV